METIANWLLADFFWQSWSKIEERVSWDLDLFATHDVCPLTPGEAKGPYRAPDRYRPTKMGGLGPTCYLVFLSQKD